MSLTGDITDASLVQDMIRRVMGTYGRLDYASNNAAIAASQVDAGGMKTADWPKAGFDWIDRRETKQRL
jgi:NAD(P)-dependent dehydrogenase (short-subunit alcohol dehydrogenase family)